MSEKMTPKKAALLGAGAALIYRFAKGKGIFNKPRFYDQHKAIKNYLNTYHNGANYGDIARTKDGWVCVVNINNEQILLNVQKSEDGSYIFSEEKLKGNG